MKITVCGNYGNEFEMTREQAESCSHPGPCDEDVRALIPLLDLSDIDPDTLRDELSEFGAWDDDELLDHTENLERWVWICAGNIIDGTYDNE